MYPSTIFASAQYIAGITTNDTSNLGSLIYNVYTQSKWLKSLLGPDAPRRVGPLYLTTPFLGIILGI